MTFLIATHNKKKLDEINRILSPLGVTAVFDDTVPDVEETGLTFRENAYIKAENGCRFTGKPCIADDSGLCVDALGGAPGVFSARYAGGHDVPYDVKISTLIKELENVPYEKRTARFTCCVCCVFPDGRVLYSEQSCEGHIGYEPRGENGFGYDPIFYVGDVTTAQLSDIEKDKISHRGKALRQFASDLRDYI